AAAGRGAAHSRSDSLRVAFGTIGVMPRLRVVGVVLLTAVLTAPLPAARPAPVTAGQAFGITLSQNGRSVSGDRFSLRVPGAKGALVLTLSGIGLVGDGLEAPAILKNETD